jgi:hypothetical protein
MWSEENNATLILNRKVKGLSMHRNTDYSLACNSVYRSMMIRWLNPEQAKRYKSRKADVRREKEEERGKIDIRKGGERKRAQKNV